MFEKKIKFIASLLPLAAILSLAAAELEVRNITPPKLEMANFSKMIVCHRPMRRGAPNLSIQNVNGKLIAHNYGHGGSGWTLAPGSAAYVNDLLLKHKGPLRPKRGTPITIIGSGIIGLTSAYDLLQRGFTNLTVMAEKFDDLTSHHAGGLFAPVSMDNNQEMQKTIDQIGMISYGFYKSIAQKKHQHFQTGASIIPAYFKNREESGLEPYVNSVMQPAKGVVVDFGNGTKRTMVVYDDGVFIDPCSMMANLRQYLENKGVKFIKKRVKSFTEIPDRFILNCSGLGARELNSDTAVESIQGHLIMLTGQNPDHLQQMFLVYFDDGQTKSGQKIKRSFYIFPKTLPNATSGDIGVIGGTFIEKADNTTPNEEEFTTLVKGARRFYGLE